MNESVKKTLSDLQAEQKAWSEYNFPNSKTYQHPYMGVVEEMGELSHSFLKQEQKIRGTWQEHEVNAMDAVGDMMVYLMDLCTKRGWDLGAITQETWDAVKQRDWQKFPGNGKDK